jgi:streptogramin lyase
MRTLATLLLLGSLTAAAAGPLTVVAGTGQPGYDGDGGPATQARMNAPFHCVLGEASGQPVLFVVEQLSHTVRRIDLKTGVITTVAGNGRKGYAGDGGPATQATLNDPHALDRDAEGNLYLADRLNYAVRKVDGKTGVITTVAGTGKAGFSGDGGPGNQAQLREPDDCCCDGKGGLLIADVADWRIRRLDLKTGLITTFAGTGKPGGKVDRAAIGDGGPATRAVLVGARAVCTDGKGNVYVCEREGNAIRKIDPQGTITTFAGTGAKGYGGDDGPARQATFNGPKAIRCDAAGNLYVADTENHAIRRIDAATGVITTVAGGRKAGDDPQAKLKRPHGALPAPDGSLYVADSENHRVLQLK